MKESDNVRKSSRRAAIAAQIEEAMRAASISRKELAQKMGKSPSEVTRWLSGTHNFTSDLLSDISDCLGVEITGVSIRSLVDGYDSTPASTHLNDSENGSIAIENISLSPAVFNRLSTFARQKRQTLVEYVEDILEKESRKESKSILDFFGSWSDEDFPEASSIIDDIRSARTTNASPEL